MPVNLKLLFLPPYSPELNPQEHIWDELREKSFCNKTFASLDLLEDHLVEALGVMETQHARSKVSSHGIGLFMLFLVEIRITYVCQCAN